MKIIGLTLGITCLLAGMVGAETVTLDVYQGWNLIAMPNVPLEPAVPDVFKTALGVEIPTLDKLSTYSPQSGSDFPYNSDYLEWFGGMLLGQGYWLMVDSAEGATIQYEGLSDGVSSDGGVTKTDMWISLPGMDQDADGVSDMGGWHLIGNPYNHLVDIGAQGANITFTDGTDVKTWAEASSAGWVSSNMVGYSGASSSDVNTGFEADQVNCLIPGFGYWILTNVPNVAMIIDGNKTYTWPE